VSTYLLDANVFIQAKNLHYGFDFCPAFWQWLIERHAAGIVGLGLKCVTPYEMLRRERARFILGPAG
jgi:hypothetical protein